MRDWVGGRSDQAGLSSRARRAESDLALEVGSKKAGGGRVVQNQQAHREQLGIKDGLLFMPLSSA